MSTSKTHRKTTTPRTGTPVAPEPTGTSAPDLQAQVAALQAQIALLVQLNHAPAAPMVAPNTLKVGVRNISSYTVGLQSPQDGDVQLFPAHDPGSYGTTAEISYGYWQTLRRQRLVAHGMLVRDDEVLGPNVVRAPADEPSDIPPSAAKNQIPDPRAWIESRDEVAIRQDIEQLTSEASVRRLFAMVDRKVWEIGEAQFVGDTKRAEKAVRLLPSRYRLVEEECLRRLDAMNPNAETRGAENMTTVRFRNRAPTRGPAHDV